MLSEATSDSEGPPTLDNVIESAETSQITSNEFLDQNIDEIQFIISEEKDGEKNISRQFPFNINEFQTTLASWAITNKIKHDQLKGLLKIWNVPLPTLPADPRTILETPR